VPNGKSHSDELNEYRCVSRERTLISQNINSLSGCINISNHATLSVNALGTPTFAYAITFGSSKHITSTATLNVGQPRTFSGTISCNAPHGATGVLIY